MTREAHESAREILIARGTEQGYITFDELDELLPPDVGSADITKWMELLDKHEIDLVPDPALRRGDVDDPAQPYFATKVELAAGDAVATGTLYWSAYATWEEDALDRLVFALVGAKVDHAQKAFADRTAALGYTVNDTKSGITIDLRATPSASLEIAIDAYAADRGGFASIAPSRIKLAAMEHSDYPHPAYVLVDAPSVRLPLRLGAPLVIDDSAHGEVELEATCTLEFREWGIKWLDVAPRRCRLPDGIDVRASGATVEDGWLEMHGAHGCRVAIELVQDGHALKFVATRLDLRKAKRFRSEHAVASTRGEVSHEPRPIVYELVTEPPVLRAADPEVWVAAFRETTDPALAALLITRFVDAPRAVVEPALRECLGDPSEDANVVVNALWCIWRRGEVDADALAELLGRDPLASVAVQAAKVAMNSLPDARSWLQQFPGSASAIAGVLELWDRRSN